MTSAIPVLRSNQLSYQANWKCVSAVQMYKFHILVFISYLLHPWVYCELTSDQLPVCLIAQLVRVGMFMFMFMLCYVKSTALVSQRLLV